MPIEVVNKYRITPDQTRDVYIGRGSPLGNPWPITAAASRATVIAKYQDWIQEKITAGDGSVMLALANIANRHQAGESIRLVCFCKPQACHGDIIKDVIMKALSQEG